MTAFAAGLVTANARWEWIQGTAKSPQGPVYGVNGVDAPRYFTGTATGAWTQINNPDGYSPNQGPVGASGTAVPNGKYMTWANNRVWMAGFTGTDSSRVRWSAITTAGPDPRVWDTQNYVDLDADDGEPITGISTVGPYVVVFKRTKAWIIYDLDTGANRRLGTNVGCVSHRSIVDTADGCFFLSPDQGVMRTDGSGVERVSDKIRGTIRKLAPTMLDRAAGEFHEGRYYLACSTGGSRNDLVLDLDLRQGAWWLHSNTVDDWAVLPVSGRTELFAADPAALRVARMYVPDELQDFDLPFSAYWKGPFHTMQTQYLRKRLREVHFDGFGRVDVATARDFIDADEFRATVFFGGPEAASTFGGAGGSFGVDDGFSYGATTGVAEARFYTPGVARAWSLVFSNSTADPFVLESYTLSIISRKN